MDNLRLAARSLVRAPGFTLSAVLVLAIGTGGSTAVFSVLRGVVLRPLSMPRSRTSWCGSTSAPPAPTRAGRFPAPNSSTSRARTAPLSVAGVRAEQQTLTGRGPPVQIRVARISGSFFATLQILASHRPGAGGGGRRRRRAANRRGDGRILAPRARRGSRCPGPHADPERAQLHHRRGDARRLPFSPPAPGGGANPACAMEGIRKGVPRGRTGSRSSRASSPASASATRSPTSTCSGRASSTASPSTGLEDGGPAAPRRPGRAGEAGARPRSSSRCCSRSSSPAPTSQASCSPGGWRGSGNWPSAPRSAAAAAIWCACS